MGAPIEHFNIVTTILPTDNLVGPVDKILLTVRPYQDVFFCLVHGFIALHPSTYSEYEGHLHERTVLIFFHLLLRKLQGKSFPQSEHTHWGKQRTDILLPSQPSASAPGGGS